MAEGWSDGGAGDGVPVSVLGIDHHRTPVAVRERLAVPPERVGDLVAALRTRLGTNEAVILSTCNRLECYLGGAHTAERIAEVLGAIGGIEPATVLGHAYHHHGSAGIRHLFRVASGLESLVLGEEQIINQVKTAYEAAQRSGSTGALLNPLFQRALGVAKEVRSSTGLSRHKLSVSSIAVDLARQVHGDLASARLLILGAGEMAELAVRYLLEQGVRSIGIVNRNQERAMELGELAQHAQLAQQAKIYGWGDLRQALAEHDLVVASTSAPHVVVHPEDVRAAMARRRRPLVLIDLAVPRDVDARCGELDDVFLYNIDHLESVVAANQRLRAEEVGAAEALVDAQVAGFVASTRPQSTSLAGEIARFFDEVIDAEADRLADRLDISDPAQRGEIRYGIQRATGKLNHRLHAWLKAHPGDPEAAALLRRILGL